MTADKRVETGPTVFGNDWTGLFLRGDACFVLIKALDYAIGCVERSNTAYDKNADLLGHLKDLRRLMRGTDEQIKTDRTVPKYYEMPKEIK